MPVFIQREIQSSTAHINHQVRFVVSSQFKLSLKVQLAPEFFFRLTYSSNCPEYLCEKISEIDKIHACLQQEGVMNLGLGTKEVTDDRLTRALRPSWRHSSAIPRDLRLQTNQLSSRGLKIREKEKKPEET